MVWKVTGVLMTEQQREYKRQLRRLRKKAIKYQNGVSNKVNFSDAMRAVRKEAS